MKGSREHQSFTGTTNKEKLKTIKRRSIKKKRISLGSLRCIQEEFGWEEPSSYTFPPAFRIQGGDVMSWGLSPAFFKESQYLCSESVVLCLFVLVVLLFFFSLFVIFLFVFIWFGCITLSFHCLCFPFCLFSLVIYCSPLHY